MVMWDGQWRGKEWNGEVRTMLIGLAAVFVGGHLHWWLYHRDLTQEMDELVWLACIKPGE